MRALILETLAALRRLLADPAARATMIVSILIYSLLYPQPYTAEVVREALNPQRLQAPAAAVAPPLPEVPQDAPWPRRRSAWLKAGALLAGGVGVAGHIEICDKVQFTGMTMVTKSITEPGSYSSGTGMEPTANWRKTAARLRNLDDMARRLRELEAEVARMRSPDAPS